MAVPNPTEGELAILKILWANHGPCSVRDVHALLSQSKDTAYTTVLKMMTIMAEKGLVERDESTRVHLYRALYPEPVIQSLLIKDLVRKAFSGSALQLVQRALETEPATAADLDNIAKLIADAKKRRG